MKQTIPFYLLLHFFLLLVRSIHSTTNLLGTQGQFTASTNTLNLNSTTSYLTTILPSSTTGKNALKLQKVDNSEIVFNDGVILTFADS